VSPVYEVATAGRRAYIVGGGRERGHEAAGRSDGHDVWRAFIATCAPMRRFAAPLQG
jgi:hypothetical protein